MAVVHPGQKRRRQKPGGTRSRGQRRQGRPSGSIPACESLSELAVPGPGPVVVGVPSGSIPAWLSAIPGTIWPRACQNQAKRLAGSGIGKTCSGAEAMTGEPSRASRRRTEKTRHGRVRFMEVPLSEVTSQPAPPLEPWSHPSVPTVPDFPRIAEPGRKAGGPVAVLSLGGFLRELGQQANLPARKGSPEQRHARIPGSWTAGALPQ